MEHIGYCIGSRWWNKGYMSEAFAGIMDATMYALLAEKYYKRKE